MEQFQKDIKQHATESSPEECCGFVCEKGKNKYIVPVTNKALEPTTFFLIDEADYIKVKNEHKVISYYHSHPFSNEAFSPLDMKSSDNIDLPLFVYSVIKDKFNIYFPNSTKKDINYLLNRPFVYNISDCWILAVDYYKVFFDIDLPRGKYRNSIEQISNENMWERDVLSNLKQSTFEEINIDSFGDLRQGDILGMKYNMKNFTHCAIYHQDNKILQVLQSRLSKLYKLNNFWKNKTCKIFRYKEF